MRFINFERVQGRITEEWFASAAAALESVRKLPRKERVEAIKKKSKVWGDVKDIYSDASHGKCWYCESRENRSHNPIDHYRPKSAVAECPEHEGYWWLAFDWENYRFCCTYCNSALRDELDEEITHGKQNHFPILDNTMRAMTPDHNWKQESPLLLDPTKSKDVQLLYFDMKGYAVAAYAEQVDETKSKRAKTSIDVYNLNHGNIKKERMVLYNRIKGLVEESCRLRKILDNHKDLPQSVVNGIEQSIDSIDQELAQRMGEDAEYSSAARCYAMGLRRQDAEWLDYLLQVV